MTTRGLRAGHLATQHAKHNTRLEVHRMLRRPTHPALRSSTNDCRKNLDAGHGPYTDTRAEHFARLALIDPDIIAAPPHATDTELADMLAVPIEQIAAHRKHVASRQDP